MAVSILLGTGVVAANTATLQFQPPEASTYYEYYLAQSNFQKTINDEFRIAYEPQIENEFLIAVTISKETDGIHVQSRYVERDMQLLQRNLGTAAQGKWLNQTFRQSAQQLIAFNPPEFILNSEGDVVRVNITDEYRDNIRRAVRSLYKRLIHDSPDQKAIENQVTAVLTLIDQHDFVPSIKRSRLNYPELNGLPLKQSDSILPTDSLYGRSQSASKDPNSEIYYRGRISCDEQLAEQSCVLLEHKTFAESGGNHASFVDGSSKLIVDPDTLQEYSSTTVTRSTTQLSNPKNPLVEEFVLLKRVFLSGEPDEKNLASLQESYYELLNKEPVLAIWNDFAEIYQPLIKRVNHAHMFCRYYSSVSTETNKRKQSKKGFKTPDECKTLKDFYTNNHTMRMFSHFENLIEPAKLSSKLHKHLQQAIEELLERRIHTLISLELRDLKTDNPELTKDELKEKAPEIAGRLIKKSPITDERHQRYLKKIPTYYAMLNSTDLTVEKPTRPSR